MKEQFRTQVSEGNYTEAYQLFKSMNREEASQILYSIGDTGNILAYGFCCFALSQEDTAENHYLASAINTNACYVKGAYALAFHHAKMAIRLSRDVKFLEHILLFNVIPEKLLDDEEAVRIAQEVMQIVPNSSSALYVLNSAKART